MSLSTNVSNLATRVATEFKDVRAEAAAHNHDADYADAGHSHPHPLVPDPPTVYPDGPSIFVDASTGNFRYVSLTQDATLNAPANGADGQKVMIRIFASGADRTVTIDAGIARLAGISDSVVVPAGKYGYIGLICEGATWTVLAAGPQQ